MKEKARDAIQEIFDVYHYVRDVKKEYTDARNWQSRLMGAIDLYEQLFDEFVYVHETRLEYVAKEDEAV